jgi:hypothetical protein
MTEAPGEEALLLGIHSTSSPTSHIQIGKTEI